jgi:hypothetical protein
MIVGCVLLLKLISGELCISNSERNVGAAANKKGEQ